MKKIFKVRMLFIAIITMLFTTNVFAYTINEMEDFQEIFTTATVSGQKITLDKDYVISESILIYLGTYELDLNGFDITTSDISVIEVLDGDLTISNSSTTLGLISTTSALSFASPLYIGDGSLTINNGVIGDVEDASDVGLYIDGGTVTINDGKFAGLIHGIYIDTGIVTINDGDFRATSLTNSNDAIGIYGGDVTINNGTFTSSSLLEEGWGIYAQNYDNDISITINNGTFTGTFTGAEFYDESDAEFVVVINNGIFEGDIVGLFGYDNYLPDITILAGTFKSIASNATERFGAIAIEYEDTVPDINVLIHEGSTMFPASTSLDTYTYEDEDYLITKTSDEVIVGKTINIAPSAHGTINANKLLALPGEEITLTITPEDGYILKNIRVTDKFDENHVQVTNNKFVMPNYNVTITSEFALNEDYEFTKGKDQKIDEFSKDDLSFTINADYSLLNKVYVDDKLLTADDYTSKSGSTIITLKNSFISSLDAKKHTIKVTFTDGKEVTTNFEIVAQQNPKTNDGILNIVALGSISLISLFGVSILLKKKMND